MATTTNFGWETPDDTDLVKDGAAAIRTALGGVDSSFVDLKGGTTGQVLAKASNTDLDFVWSADAAGIPATIFDAKGDLIAATAADTAGRLAVGTNGQVLTADSTAGTGLKWSTLTTGGMTLLASGTLSGSSLDLTSISSSYNALKLVLRGFYFDTAVNCRLSINNTQSIYVQSDVNLVFNNAMSSSDINITASSVYPNASNKNAAVIDFFDYASTTSYKIITPKVISESNSSPGSFNLYNSNMWAKDANAISRITVYPASGNFSGGTYILYGVK